jgi:hypothetical protein
VTVLTLFQSRLRFDVNLYGVSCPSTFNDVRLCSSDLLSGAAILASAFDASPSDEPNQPPNNYYDALSAGLRIAAATMVADDLRAKCHPSTESVFVPTLASTEAKQNQTKR